MSKKQPDPGGPTDGAPTSTPTSPSAGGGDHAGDGPGGRRVDPPGQDDNVHSQRPDIPPGQMGEALAGTDASDLLEGGKKDDSLNGGAGDDDLRGGGGNDTLDGGDGADTLSGGKDGDVLTGGAGADVFDLGGAAKGHSDGLDRITDFTHGEDSLRFGDGVSTGEGHYTELTADSFDAALAAANAKMAEHSSLDVVAVQVGDDVIVFVDQGDTDQADPAVVLVGRTLADIGSSDIG